MFQGQSEPGVIIPEAQDSLEQMVCPLKSYLKSITRAFDENCIGSQLDGLICLASMTLLL